MRLGEKLLQLRKAYKMTLDELSAKSSVAKATLSRLENNITTGTLRTHMKIVEALGISLPELYREIESSDQMPVALEPKPLESAEIFTYDIKAQAVILAKQIAKKNMLPQLVMLQAGGSTVTEENSAGTEKFVFCLEGKIDARIGENTYSLKKGGSLYFKSSFSHTFKNIGKKTAKFICVSSPVAL